jgi:hypothetical protein
VKINYIGKGMYKYKLFRTTGSNSQENEGFIRLLEEIKAKYSEKIDYDVVNLETLSDKEKVDLIETFRLISRKNGIGVVSRGNGALPISRSKNIGNMGILLQYEDGEAKKIYPHEKNNKRVDIKSILNTLIESDNINDILDQDCISEKDISRMISTFPELIEHGLEFIDTEVEVESGRIDAVFKNKKDEHLLIEIEIEVGDNAIGQVQRFATYSEKNKIPRDKIRLGLVCAKISENILKACKDANIEVFTLNLEKRT